MEKEKEIDFSKVMSLIQGIQQNNQASAAQAGTNQQQMRAAEAAANNSVASGVTQGTAIGSKFGGTGAAIGAGVGAVSGLLSKGSKKRQAKDAKNRALADIEKDKQDQVATQIGGIINNLRGIL
jgi:hypothetical protein